MSRRKHRGGTSTDERTRGDGRSNATARSPGDEVTGSVGKLRITSTTIVIALVVATLAVGVGLRLFDLGFPRTYVFDEVYYAKDAKTLLDGRLAATEQQKMDGMAWEPGDEISWPHPGMGKITLAAGVAVLGNDSWGWRIAPATAGAILLLLVYPLARRLRLSRAWALAALVMATSDTLLLAESRIATLDIFVALWTTLCIYLALRYVQADRRWWWLALCGLAGGMAVGTKWSGALALVAAAAVLVVCRRRRDPGTALGDHVLDVLASVWLPILCLAALPALVYIASYIPYFAHGHGLDDWLRLQREMKQFNFSLKAEHSYASRAYTWIFDVRPVWLFYEGEPKVRGIIALGNPLLWWASVPAILGLFAAGFVRRSSRAAKPPGERRWVWPLIIGLAVLDAVAWLRFLWAYLTGGRDWAALSRLDRTTFFVALVLLVTGFLWFVLRSDRRLVLPPFLALLLYLPWLGTGRTSFLYYMTPVVPFLAISVALAFSLLAGPRLVRCRWAALAFGAGALAMWGLWEYIGRAGAWLLWDLPARVSRGAGVATIGFAIVVLLGAVIMTYVRPRLRPAWRYLTWGLVGVITATGWVFIEIVLARPIDLDHFYKLMWLSSWI